MNLSYTYTEDDLTRVAKQQEAMNCRKTFSVTAVILGSILSGIALKSLLAKFEWGCLLFLVVGAAWMTLGIGQLLMRPVFMRKTKGILKFPVQIELCIDDQGFSFQQNKTVSWNAIRKIWFLDQDIVFRGKKMQFSVPNRAFKIAEEIDELAEIINRKQKCGQVDIRKWDGIGKIVKEGC